MKINPYPCSNICSFWCCGSLYYKSLTLEIISQNYSAYYIIETIWHHISSVSTNNLLASLFVVLHFTLFKLFSRKRHLQAYISTMAELLSLIMYEDISILCHIYPLSQKGTLSGWRIKVFRQTIGGYQAESFQMSPTNASTMAS